MRHTNFVRFAALGALGAAMLFAVACGSNAVEDGSSSASAEEEEQKSSAPIDPCALLTMEEVTAAAGQPMKAGEQGKGSNPFGQVICAWAPQKVGGGMVVQVSVIREADFVKDMRKVYSAQKLFDQAKTLYPDAKDVSGAGSAAFRSDNTLNVVSGRTTFSVMVGLPGRANVADETLVALASLVESRIK